MSLTSKQKALYVFSALFSLVVLLVGRERITELISGSSKEKVQVSSLLKEFSAIPIHSGDARSESPKSFDKGVITGVTADLYSSASSKEVLSYYLQTLPPLGWTLSSNASDTERPKLKFCKAGVSLIVDVSVGDAGTKYYLGLVWTKFRQSPAYCAPPHS